MNNYLLFGGHDSWERNGGWEDFVGYYSKIEDAIEEANKFDYDNDEYYYQWAHIVNLDFNHDNICWDSDKSRYVDQETEGE